MNDKHLDVTNQTAPFVMIKPMIVTTVTSRDCKPIYNNYGNAIIQWHTTMN